MSSSTVLLTGTHRYRLWKLGRLVRSPVGVGLVVCMVLPYALIAWIASSAIPLLFGVLTALWSGYVVHRFLRMEEYPMLPPHPSAAVTEWLSAPLMSVLAPRKHIDAGDVLDAAMQAPRGAFLLREAGIDPAAMHAQCREQISSTIDVTEFLRDAAEEARRAGETTVDAPAVLLLFFTYVSACIDVLHAADVSREDLPAMLHWERFHHYAKRQLPWWSAKRIRQSGAIGRSWVMGYADELNALVVDIDVSHPQSDTDAIIHQQELDMAMQALDKSGASNVLVLGPVGSGKRTFAANLARRVRERERAEHQSFTRAVLLQTETLLSGTGNPEQALLRALQRAEESGSYLMVIRNIAGLLQAATPGMRSVLASALESPHVRIIGIADTQEYHRLIKNDTAIASLCTTVTLSDPPDADVLRVLMSHDVQMAHHNVRVPYRVLVSLLALCRRYLANNGLPGIAVDVLDQSIGLARDRGDRVLTEDHVRDVVSRLSKVNVRAMNADERERLLQLEEMLSSKVIGQPDAVRAVSNALKRARMDVRDRHRPVGTFLFLGPTGVGKTQTAKVLAQEYFGSADTMIRLDMNEFSSADSVAALTGSADGSSEGFLTQRVYDQPFSLVLLDEIEKAHPSVLNVFLQMLDEGTLRDSVGRTTDFRNTIIIATSNAGALFIRDAVSAGNKVSSFKQDLIEEILRERLFTPEFINRFDETVVFSPLSHDDALRVARLMLQEVTEDIKRSRGIMVTVADDAVDVLLQRGYDAAFGARELRRVIVTALETYLADYLLRRSVRRGEAIHIEATDLVQSATHEEGA